MSEEKDAPLSPLFYLDPPEKPETKMLRVTFTIQKWRKMTSTQYLR